MIFEVGKYYKHESGLLLAIRGKVPTTMWGETLIAESPDDIMGLRPVGEDETSTAGFVEIPEKEWKSEFPEEK